MSTSPHSRLLAPTLADLGGSPRAMLTLLHDRGFRAVQFSALTPDLRPRELDQSARRDVLATLRRNELQLGGESARETAFPAAPRPRSAVRRQE